MLIMQKNDDTIYTKHDYFNYLPKNDHNRKGVPMNFDCELSFLCDVLKKAHIKTAVISPHDPFTDALDSWLGAILGPLKLSSVTVQQILGPLDDKTKYNFSNLLKLNYVILRTPVKSEKNLLFIGPYLSAHVTPNDVMKIAEKLGFAPSTQRVLQDYYSALPIITDSDRLFTVIDTFCEHIWETNAFSIVEIDGIFSHVSVPEEHTQADNDLTDTLARMEMMEMRYAFENELIRAVVFGQQHTEKILSTIFNEQMFEKRLPDSLRNAKNYCIIMNTLLRKAAEQGGVHPLYIDRTSSAFAKDIEALADAKTVPEFMKDMFSSYCRLVRKHSTKAYSPIVKKTILLIDADISSELSLHSLASKLEISKGYLASVFKRETGKTVSEYISEKRINRAMHLLNTTDLQIQTVAMHCGVMDVQYFSKLFKKHTGKTPKEFRKASASR